MEKIEEAFAVEKETKRTFRYAAIETGRPSALKTVYIAKWALGTPPPKTITVTVEVEA